MRTGKAAMRIVDVFRTLEYVGRAEGDKKSYFVFEGPHAYLVVASNTARSYNANVVEREAVDLLARRFKGRKVTTSDVVRRSGRPKLLGDRFAALNALYAMTATGRARKLQQRKGRSMVFKIK